VGHDVEYNATASPSHLGEGEREGEVVCYSACNNLLSACINYKKAVFTAFYLSGKRDSNPRPSAWEADALPLSYSRNFKT
jgi:hypothetical protein